MINTIKLTAFLFFISLLTPVFAQDEEQTTVDPASQKGFQVGLYVGSYIANRYTASLHDGYGLDLDGNRNSFETSYMYNKIVMEYGGGYGNGLPDYIAQELNLMRGEWNFEESDMPTEMRYQPAFVIGLNCRYSVDNRNVILVNINAVRLTANGGFTIQTIPQYIPGQTSAQTIREFKIRGIEQRLLMQVGYQHLFGKNERINFLAEGGLNMTLAKLGKNDIQINNLNIDLTSFYQSPVGNAYSVVRRPGIGFGVFTGVGLNVNASEAFIIQVLYSPTYEGVNLGDNPQLKWQHSFGLRAYYKL